MPSPIQLSAGQLFAKDFRVVRPLSSGGMGSVYVVQQTSTGAERALKLMHRELVQDPKQRARFEQEAKIGASIRSDHVVKVIVAGVDDETGLPYLVMELLEGCELEAHLEARGPLPPGEVATIFSQLCHALSRTGTGRAAFAGERLLRGAAGFFVAVAGFSKFDTQSATSVAISEGTTARRTIAPLTLQRPYQRTARALFVRSRAQSRSRSP
jgi:hypothetical protein